MSFNFKNALLAGTAIVAVSAFAASPALAVDEFLVDANDSGTVTTTAPDETADTGLIWNSGSTGGAVLVNNHDLRVVTSGTIGFSANGTIGDSSSTIAGIAANATGQTLIIDNVVGGNNGAGETATISNGISRNGFAALSLVITGEDTDNTGADTFTVDINGNVDLGTGTLTLTSDVGANGNNDLFTNVSGNLTSGVITLNATGSADNALVLDGTTAQTVTGSIAGTAGVGATIVRVDNAAGVTFNSAVGTGTAIDDIRIEKAAGNSSATFKAAVTGAINLGADGVAGNTNTVTFDGTAGSYTVTGVIAGTATETNNIVVTNTSGTAKVITLASASTANLSNLSVTGTATTLTTGSNLTVGASSVGTGATLATTGGTLTTATTLASGATLSMAGGAVTGNVNGSSAGVGTLSVANSGTLTGNIGNTQGLAAITIATGQTLTATGTVRATTTTLAGAGSTLGMAAGQNLTSNVVTAGATGTGAITLTDTNATTAIVGNIGDSTKSLASLTITASNGGNTVTTTGNLFANAIAINDADTLSFLGTSAQTVSGTIADGIVTVGNGVAASNVTFNGILGGTGLGSANVAALSAATFNANVTSTGAFTNNGTTTMGVNTVLAGNGGFAGTGTYVLNVNDTNNNNTLQLAETGSLSAAGTAIDLSAEKVRINFLGNSGVGTVTIANGDTNGAALPLAANISDNSIVYNTSLALNGLQDIDLTISRTALTTLGTTQNNKNAGVVLDTLINSTNAEMVLAQDNIAKASTQNDLNEVIESLTPTVDGGAVQSGFSTSVQSIDVSNTRLASLRNGNETGMVAGEMGNGLSAWIQGFGQMADQDRRDGVDGYEADTYGIAVGLDTANLLAQGTVGAALSYANSDVDSKNANRTNSDVDSYQVSVYGSYDVAPQTYLTGTLAYAWNDIDQTRHNVGGIVGLNANAGYDSDQYIAYLEAGHDFAVADRTTLTPHVLAHYQHINIDDYRENGAGGLNQNVNNDDLDIFELGVGAELAWDLDGYNGSKVRPALNVGYRHDLVGDGVSSTSNFTGGGASFRTEGLEPAEGTFNVGASIGYALDNNWEFTADYDFEVKSDYDAHSGFVRAGYKF